MHPLDGPTAGMQPLAVWPTGAVHRNEMFYKCIDFPIWPLSLAHCLIFLETSTHSMHNLCVYSCGRRWPWKTTVNLIEYDTLSILLVVTLHCAGHDGCCPAAKVGRQRSCGVCTASWNGECIHTHWRTANYSQHNMQHWEVNIVHFQQFNLFLVLYCSHTGILIASPVHVAVTLHICGIICDSISWQFDTDQAKIIITHFLQLQY